MHIAYHFQEKFKYNVTDCLTTLEGNFEGEIAELIIFDQPLSDRQRKVVEEHLRQKWFAQLELIFKSPLKIDLSK